MEQTLRARSSLAARTVLGAFVLSRLLLISLTCCVALARRMSPLQVWNQWDGQWFVAIALHGYHWGMSGKSPLAFFPLYPLLIRVGTMARIDAVLVAIVISNIAFLGALIYFYRLVSAVWGPLAAGRAVWILALFPTAFFTFAPYSEALFLLCALGALYHARKADALVAGSWVAAAVLTRPTGFVLLPAILAAWPPSVARSLFRGSDGVRGPAEIRVPGGAWPPSQRVPGLAPHPSRGSGLAPHPSRGSGFALHPYRRGLAATRQRRQRSCRNSVARNCVAPTAPRWRWVRNWLLGLVPTLLALAAYLCFLIVNKLPVAGLLSAQRGWHRALTYPWTGFSASMQWLLNHGGRPVGWAAEDLLQLGVTLAFLALTVLAWRTLDRPIAIYCAGFWLLVLTSPEWLSGPYNYVPFNSMDRFVLALFPLAGWAATLVSERRMVRLVVASASAMVGTAWLYTIGAWVG